MRALLIIALVAACSGRSDKPAAPAAPNHLRIVYEIDLEKAVDDRAETLRRDLDALFADKKIAATVTRPVVPVGAVRITPGDPAKKAEIEALVKSTYDDATTPRDCDPSDGAGAVCLVLSVGHAGAIKKAALAAAVTTIKARIASTKLAPGARVVSQGEEIVVELPALESESLMNLRDIVARTGQLAFQVVDNDSPFMKQVFAHVGQTRDGAPTDPAAIEAEIAAEIDQWRPDSGGETQTDYYLIAHDREAEMPLAEARRIGCTYGGAPQDGKVRCRVTGRVAIETYLRHLAEADPTRFKLPDDRELGFELIQPRREAKDPRPVWRSYYLERGAALTGSSITNATSSNDPNTDAEIVLLDFGRDGGRVFGELTARITGKKLATILDGRIRSAPIINGPIRGGRASIWLGSDERAEREANELALVLKTGSLPAPLRESSVSELP